MPFPGGLRETRNSCRSTSIKCSNEPAAAHRISFLRDDDTPENREANKREGEEYLRVVLEEAGAARVVGEDLGVVPEYVRPNLRYAWYRRIQDSAVGNARWDDHSRREIRAPIGGDLRNTRSRTNSRFLGRSARTSSSETGQQARATLEKIALFAGLNSKIDQLDYEKDFYPAVMDALFRCNSWIAVVMITDLLARKYRFNVPGTKANLNWTRRIQRSIAKLRSSRKERKRMQLIHELLEKTGRV